MAEQSFSNHTRYVPTFHFFVLPVLVLNFGWAVGKLVRLGISGDGVVYLLTALALLLLAIAHPWTIPEQHSVERSLERPPVHVSPRSVRQTSMAARFGSH